MAASPLWVSTFMVKNRSLGKAMRSRNFMAGITRFYSHTLRSTHARPWNASKKKPSCAVSRSWKAGRSWCVRMIRVCERRGRACVLVECGEAPIKTKNHNEWFDGSVSPNKRRARTLVAMKRLAILCWVLLLAVCPARAQPAGFLQAKNARIVHGQGEEVILRGMGLGGWMLQEGYMLGVRNEGTQHSIKSRITDLIGKEDCAKFYQLWLENHMTRSDVELLAKSGFNSIRLPMHYNLF